MFTLKRFFRSSWFQTILYLILIAGLTYLFLWRLGAAVPEDRAWLPEKSDLGQVFFPPRYYFAKTLDSGEFPLWNPHIYSGYPQFADPQAATFYPIAHLFAQFAGANFSMNTIALDIGLHYFLAGAFAFLFFRHIFKSNLPALLSALVFEFGGYLTSYPPVQLSELEVVPWLPLTLLLLTLAIERRSWLLTAVAGVSMGQVFLAGRPQSYLTIGLITIAWLVYTAHRAQFSWIDIAKKTGVLAGFSLGTAAVQLIPTLQLTRLSTRSSLTYAAVAEGGFPFEQLPGFFVPQLLGTQNLYVGLVTLLLAGLALYKRKGLFWGGIFLVALFGSVGKYLILFDALYLFERLGFPGYLRNVERLAFAMTFSLAALSGYGIQLIKNMDKRLLRQILTAVTGILATAVLITWLWAIVRQPEEAINPYLPVNALSFAAMILLGGYFALWLWRQQPQIAQIALVFIAIVDVMSVNQGRFFVERADSFAPGNDIERVAAAPSVDSAFYRTVYDQTTSQDFGSLAGVDNVGGLPPLMLTDYEKLRGILDEYRRNALLNVEMVVTTGTYTDPAFELVAQEDNVKYYHFTAAKPRAYLVEGVVEVPHATEAADRLASWEFDFWNKALVVGDTGIDQDAVLAASETAAMVDRSANELTVQVTTEKTRLLVISDTYYPGWQAEINGVPTEIYQTNVALRGVVVPSGTHTITMRFRPKTFFIGVTISTLTYLVVLIWWVKKRLAIPKPTL